MVANRQYMVREEEEVALLNRFNTRPREKRGGQRKRNRKKTDKRNPWELIVTKRQLPWPTDKYFRPSVLDAK